MSMRWRSEGLQSDKEASGSPASGQRSAKRGGAAAAAGPVGGGGGGGPGRAGRRRDGLEGGARLAVSARP